MKSLILAMALASTLLTPAVASAAIGPATNQRPSAVIGDTPPVDLRQTRREARQERRGARQERRQTPRAQVRRADRRQDRRVNRRVDRRVAQRQQQRRIDNRRLDNRRLVRRVDRRYDRRYDNRVGGGVVRADRRWNRQWRNNRRYDYGQYRRSNRRIFNQGRYYSPYRNRGYNRLGVGVNIGRGFYGNRYQINDPYRYRLPPAYGSYRWVRYYDDALLVDTRRGVVADVVYRLFN